METSGTGFCDDMLIHPGETLLEAMEDRNVSQSELARRTGASEKHVSRVINGKDGISASFALALEYALGIEACFWMNLQSQYDEERVRILDQSTVSLDELSELAAMPETLSYWKSIGLIEATAPSIDTVIRARKILRIRNLGNAAKCLDSPAYRSQELRQPNNPCALLAWQRVCEARAESDERLPPLDASSLRKSLPALKEAMALQPEEFVPAISKTLAQSGVSLQIAPALDGASVRGMATLLSFGSALIAIAAKQESMASFWLTLFHEIAHILLDDISKGRIDYPEETALRELRANKYADDLLIDREALRQFKTKQNLGEAAIAEFAATQNVPAFIVEERLEREALVEKRSRHHYEWGFVRF